MSTTTYAYDNNGNLSQKTTDGIITTYLWDYANRLVALGSGNNGTTTYGYDAFGARVFQIATTSTTTYANRWYSVASTTKGATLWATTTEYLFNSDTLIGTVDHQYADGVATSSEEVRYIHPDHLGSIAVTTDESGAVKTVKDFYPYGSERISTGPNISKTYIGLFNDAASELLYANARYLDPARGQFLSQDPVFIGGPRSQDLKNPQTLNSYLYANGNPISFSDRSGLLGEWGGRSVFGIGIHQYVYWKPERTDLIDYSALGIPAGTTEFTMGFYAPPSGFLEAGIYYSNSANTFGQEDFSQHEFQRLIGNSQEIEGLSAEEEAAAINTMGRALNDFDNRSVRYPSKIETVKGTGINSNSGIHTLATITNLGPSFRSFDPLGYSSGVNLLLPSHSFSSPAFQRQIQIAALQLQVAQLQLQVIQLQTANAKSTPQVLR